MRRFALCLALVTACGDDGGTADGDGGAPDAAIDGYVLPATVPIEYAPALEVAPAPSSITELVLGPDDRVYGLASGRLFVSNDGGATFAPAAATQSLSGLVANDAALFGRDGMFVAPILKRSIDNGASFETVTVPGLGTEDRMFIAARGADLWVQPVPTAGPTTIQHSTNDGSSFTPLALPIAQGANFYMAPGPGSLAISNAFGIFRTDGATWTDLGPTPSPIEHQLMIVTHAGTILAPSLSGAFSRRAVDDTTWSTESVNGAIGAIVQRANGQLVRVQKYAGTIETSDDDGVTWQQVAGVAWDNCTLASLAAVPSGLVGTCFDEGATMVVRLPTGASTWTIEVPENQQPAGPFVDVGIADDGTIALASQRGVWLSRDNGATWTRTPWRPGTEMPLGALAIAPDGNQLFVGSLRGQYAFLDRDGNAIQQSTVGPVDENIIQADYLGSTEVIVTTSEREFTQGSVWRGNPDRIGTWEVVNPYRLEGNPQFDPTAGFLGVSACDETVGVGVRRWFGTNAWDNALLVKFQFNDFNALWFDIDLPAVGALPIRAMSCAPNGTVAFTFKNELDAQLWVGSFQGLGIFQMTSTTTLPPGVTVAKFAPDDHLWVLSGGGVWRSTAPVKGGL